MYSLWDYRRMLDDRVRIDAYARSLAATIRPDDVVLDLGCGFGAFAVLSARLGARLAYGVDPNPAVSLAPEVARANGVDDRVRFWRGMIDDVVLDPPPTILVADVRGVMPWGAGAIKAWNGARKRLAPGARTIPERDVVLVQPMRSEILHRSLRSLDDVVGITIRSLEQPLANGQPGRLGDEILLGEAKPVFDVRYGAPLVARWSGEARFDLPAGTVVDGFQFGFEAHLPGGISYRSFGPGSASVYGSTWLPAPERITTRAGEPVTFRIRTEDESSYPLILWAVDVGAKEGPWQSELLGGPVPLDVVRAASPDHRPAADAEDDLEAAILTAYGKGRSVKEAASDAVAALAGRVDAAKAERRATELAQRRQGRVVRRFGA